MVRNNKDKDEYDWIETVVKIAQAVGFNPIRVRWKLRAWQDRMKAGGRKISGKAEAVARKHKTCPKCRAINSIDEKVCAKCGAKLHSRPVEMADRFFRHFALGLSAETFLGLSFIFVYSLIAVKSPHSGWISTNFYDLISYGGNSLFSITGNPNNPIVYSGLIKRWYTLWTAVFLHAGIYHIGFNTYALLYVTPIVRKVYSSSKLMVVFFVTGILSSAVSMAWLNIQSGGIPRLSVSIGASGAICGLIGLMLVWGHRDGTFSGMTIRNQMARWVFYILIFGYFIGADNAAHLGGLAAGGLMSLFLRPDYEREESTGWRFAGAGVWLAVLGAVAMITYLVFTAPTIALPGAM